MKLFSPLYERVMHWAAHPKAKWYLAALSFMESSFFPIPTVFMLVPMVAAKPKQGWQLALIATVTSVLGGLLGYLIGYALIEIAMPLIIDFGYLDEFDLAREWFAEWGFWALFLAGVSPIPYKIFTIAAGTLSMHLIPFVVASLVGRSIQFFLAAGLIMLLGPKFEPVVRRYVDWFGWSTVILAIVIYLVMH
ncbi:MAG: DedA family protein [Gammaproteobacteria bacterium]|nr:DedA family protein [Gammaproteobacteria bacterium]